MSESGQTPTRAAATFDGETIETEVTVNAATPTKSIEIESPIGTLRLTSDGSALVGLEMLDEPSGRTAREATPDCILAQARRELDGYFAGKRREFEVPVDPHGTPFQVRVWQALRDIP